MWLLAHRSVWPAWLQILSPFPPERASHSYTGYKERTQDGALRYAWINIFPRVERPFGTNLFANMPHLIWYYFEKIANTVLTHKYLQTHFQATTAPFTLPSILHKIYRDLWLDHNRLFGNNPKLSLFHPLPPSSNVVEMMIITSFSTISIISSS